MAKRSIKWVVHMGNICIGARVLLIHVKQLSVLMSAFGRVWIYFTHVRIERIPSLVITIQGLVQPCHILLSNALLYVRQLPWSMR